MIRAVLALLALTILVSCGSGRKAPPRNLNNACAILDENRSWTRDLAQVERKWGIPPYVILATIYQESKFVHDAKTPLRFTLGIIPRGRQSSAFGYSQALDGTWDEYRRDQGRRFARRTNFDDSVDFMGWYMSQSSARLGIPPNDARNQYLAYHEGRTGFARGSYRRKSWLQRVASETASRAETYRAQLASCGRA